MMVKYIYCIRCNSNKLEELITLCRDCHHTIHGLMRMFKRLGKPFKDYNEIKLIIGESHGREKNILRWYSCKVSR